MPPVAEADAVYEVLSPLGEPAVEMVTLASRLDTLEGKLLVRCGMGGSEGTRVSPLSRRCCGNGTPP